MVLAEGDLVQRALVERLREGGDRLHSLDLHPRENHTKSAAKLLLMCILSVMCIMVDVHQCNCCDRLHSLDLLPRKNGNEFNAASGFDLNHVFCYLKAGFRYLGLDIA